MADIAGTVSLHIEVYRKKKEGKDNNAHHKMGDSSVKGPEGIHEMTTEYWKTKDYINQSPRNETGDGIGDCITIVNT